MDEHLKLADQAIEEAHLRVLDDKLDDVQREIASLVRDLGHKALDGEDVAQGRVKLAKLFAERAALEAQAGERLDQRHGHGLESRDFDAEAVARIELERWLRHVAEERVNEVAERLARSMASDAQASEAPADALAPLVEAVGRRQEFIHVASPGGMAMANAGP